MNDFYKPSIPITKKIKKIVNQIGNNLPFFQNIDLKLFLSELKGIWK